MQLFTPRRHRYQIRTISIYFLMMLLCCGSVLAQKENPFDAFTKEVDSLAKRNDTMGVTQAFTKGAQWASAQGISVTDEDLLAFQLNEIRYLLRFSKITVDTAIEGYLSTYNKAVQGKSTYVQAKSLGYLANAFRSKRELGKAFEFNQKQIIAARQSSDTYMLGRAYITELDIAYNSLPSPMPAENLRDLIKKGEYAISFSEENKLLDILPFAKLYLSKFYVKQGDYKHGKDILLGVSDEEPLPVTFSKYEQLCEIAQQTGDLKNYRNYTLEFKWRAYQTKRTFVALNAHNYLLDYALTANNLDSAAYYVQRLEENLKEVDTTKYLDYLDVSYSSLAQYYHGKDPVKELQYLSYSSTINKTIIARQREAFSAILKYNNELSQLEEQNTSLAKTNLFFKNNLFVVLGLLLLLVVVIVVVLRKYKRSRLKAREALLEKREMAQTMTKKHIELNNKQWVYFEELKYLKADRNYVEFHTESKQYIDRNSFGTVIGQLPPNFVQVHRSFVINKNFIKTSTGNHVILLPEIEIPLSRTFKNNLKEAL